MPILTNVVDVQRFHIAPTKKQLLGRASVVGLIMNRTIGSGIFTQPVNVLQHAGSAGAAIVIWIYAGIIVVCIVACWLELGLNIPFHNIVYNQIQKRVSTPRSGGDKNYVGYRPITFDTLGLLLTKTFAAGIHIPAPRPLHDLFLRHPIPNLW